VSSGGVVTAFGLSPANCDERPIGEFLISSDGRNSYRTDKGFFSVAWERRWLEGYGTLVAATPQKSSKQAWPWGTNQWAAGKQQIVEGMIW
jgi:hypothetical protein